MDPLTLSLLLGGLSAGAAGLGSYLGNRGQQGTEQISRLSPNQLSAQDQSLKQVMSILGQGDSGFAPIEAKARKDFNEVTLPGISSRFTSQFGPGQRQGGAFAQIVGQAGKGLDTNLAAMKSNYQSNLLSSLLNFGGQSRFDSFHTPKPQGVFGSSLAALSPSIGAAIPMIGMQNKGQGGGGLDQDTLALILSLLGGQGQNSNMNSGNSGQMSNMGGQGLNSPAIIPQSLQNLRQAGF